VFHETSAEYFSWLAHDDRLLPNYIEKLAAALDENPEAVAAVPWVRLVGFSHGIPQEHHEGAEVSSGDLATRLRSLLRRDTWYLIYGLRRREVLRGTRLFRPEWGADVLLDFELLLRGPFVVVPEVLFEYRISPDRRLEEAHAGLLPEATAATQVQFPYTRLWLSLWRITGDQNRSVARVARRELILALMSRSWRVRISWDFSFKVQREIRRGRYARAAASLVAIIVLDPTSAPRRFWRRLGQGSQVTM